MTLKNAAGRYGSPLIVLHWLTLLLMVAVYACIELREFFPKGSDTREALKTWHFMLGLAIFGLVWVRLIVRFSGPVPAIVPKPPKWQLYLAHLVDFAIYVFMIAMPLLGWAALSGEGKAVPFFGLELPPLIGQNEALAKRLEQIHELGGTVGYFLIGLHAAAALVHHYLMRDNTLRRILPT